eukprot:TRINITY_DN14725_c0_g1_i4.p1 TRINITY_DN14725_c0_g1~~TRINITY_DN14725_c0_g1_i4.p1  ORF type:complete len:246 (+),score=20.51 TRINITY_DN14725_c0_g1_i4:69-806(+)
MCIRDSPSNGMEFRCSVILKIMKINKTIHGQSGLFGARSYHKKKSESMDIKDYKTNIPLPACPQSNRTIKNWLRESSLKGIKGDDIESFRDDTRNRRTSAEYLSRLKIVNDIIRNQTNKLKPRNASASSLIDRDSDDNQLNTNRKSKEGIIHYEFLKQKYQNADYCSTQNNALQHRHYAKRRFNSTSEKDVFNRLANSVKVTFRSKHYPGIDDLISKCKEEEKESYNPATTILSLIHISEPTRPY